MDKSLFSVEMPFKVEFYDVDTMGVVWHGNYVKFMEAVRCIMLDRLGYGYDVMMREGYAFPVITINLKYVKSLVFGENAVIRAFLLEYKDKLRIKYEVLNSSGKIATKAETTQIAVDWNTRQPQFESPELFVKRVEETINKVK